MVPAYQGPQHHQSPHLQILTSHRTFPLSQHWQLYQKGNKVYVSIQGGMSQSSPQPSEASP